VEQLERALADALVELVAEHARRRDARELDAAPLVEERDRVGAVLDEGAEKSVRLGAGRGQHVLILM
jgi:hypothetical protein